MTLELLEQVALAHLAIVEDAGADGGAEIGAIVEDVCRLSLRSCPVADGDAPARK